MFRGLGLLFWVWDGVGGRRLQPLDVEVLSKNGLISLGLAHVKPGLHQFLLQMFPNENQKAPATHPCSICSDNSIRRMG